MKKRSIANLLLLLAATAVFFTGCKEKDGDGTAQNKPGVHQYTCPMHPQIVQDKPGKCPICGMDLVPKQAAGQVAGIDTGLAQLLKPVNEQVIARTTTTRPESSMRIFSLEVQGSMAYDRRKQASIASRVSGRIEKLYIKYNYQPVKKGQLIMEIYSPDLAAAQRELLYLSQTGQNADLIEKAKLRLQLLGMQPEQIHQVIKTGSILYRVPVYSNASGYILETVLANAASVTPAPAGGMSSSGGGGGSDMGGGMSGGGGSSMSDGTSSPAAGQQQMPAGNSAVLVREGQYVGEGQSLFTVYNNTSLVAEFAFNPSLAPHIKKGQKLVFRKTADPETVFTGSIGLIQPTFRAGQNFTIARVYTSDSRFKVGEFISANVPVVARGWWLPASAVLQLGTKSVVFKKEGAVFVPKVVTKGMSVEGMVQIMGGVSGWEVALTASYLVDSESFIRIAAANQTNEQ